MIIPLGEFPSRLQQYHIAGIDMLVKRDDVCAQGYAGNKLRKLELLLAEARQRGARRIITAGATGSHHGFATAYHGRRLGFDVSLVLFPQRVTPHVREMLLLMHAAGAELRWVRRMEAVPFGLWRARTAHRRQTPLVIPPGGSSATGTLGYVRAGLELADQLATTGQRPTVIHVAAGTLGTAAGLAIGLAWAGLATPIAATRITSRLVTSERVLKSLIRQTLALLREPGTAAALTGAVRPDALPSADAACALVTLRHDQIGAGYGHATPAGVAATEAFGRAGLLLDATYTAKSAAALLADAPHDGLPLFWHTLSAVTPTELRGVSRPADLPAPFRAYLR
jgi:D-cysteine desulfhydrase